MKSFDRADDAFIQAAVDDTRRRDLIKTMARRRTFMFWCAVVISVGALICLFAGASEQPHNFGIGAVEFTAAAMAWMQVFKCEYDLRLLKLVDKLKK